jgi:putative Ig domain-containing protein
MIKCIARALVGLMTVGSVLAQSPATTIPSPEPTECRGVASPRTFAPIKRTGPRVSADGLRALARRAGAPALQTTAAGFEPQTSAEPPIDVRPVRPVRTPPLRNMPPIIPPGRGEDHGREVPEPIRPAPPIDSGEADTLHQAFPGVSAPTATGISFEGVGTGIPGFVPNSNPPDTNGRIGATQYVQWNNTSFAVWDKSGTRLYGPVAGNTLFQPLGGACASHNDGDPVVAYDILAGRWILSQFVVGASPSFSHQCVAVSQTQDATGAYFLYDFVTDATNFVDYPKIGVWPDGYYMSAHVFNPAGTTYLAGRIYVFERTKMIQGLPARQVSANLPTVGGSTQYGFLPADLDSQTPPPAGEAEFVMGPDPGLNTRIDSTRVAVTWDPTPSIAALSTTRVTIVSGGNAPCATGDPTNFPSSCVPQPGVTNTSYLDNLSFHFMYRLPYRNFGGSPVQESLVANITRNGTTGGTSHDDIQWYEFRNAGSSSTAPSVFQQGSYDPDGAWRFMGSIAMDKDHNIALGYSKSSTSIIPGIYMTGRLSSDPVNTMGAETTVLAGAGVQTAAGGNRWGDYSAMTVDPIDQCTFWYTNEYLPSNGAFNWATRVAAFKFPSCSPAPSWGTVSGTITSCATGAPLSGVVVNLSSGFAGASDATGHYSISVPAGTYTVSASDADRACATSSPASSDVVVSSGGTVTQNFCMTGTSNLQSNGTTINDALNGNGNGVVNANECVSLSVSVKNNGCANESAITATLTTSTPGVTVTQGTAAYPDLAIDAAGANATPFKIQTSNTFVCGTIINLTLNLTYASGNRSIGLSVPTCSGGPSQVIPTSSIALTDASQPDRLARDGNPSTCGGKGCPGAINTAGTRNYKTFNFTNSGGAAACIAVQVNAACGSGGPAGDIESIAYLGSYTPPTAQNDTAHLCNNYLGDSGVSGLGTTVSSTSYSFSVPAMSNFVVVVSTATGSTTCTQFSGLVSGFFDFTAGPGACPACVPPATPTASNGGPYCTGATIQLTTPTVSGATYSWTGPNGFSSNQQNPTRANAALADAGTYSVTVTVDGCTSAAGTTNVVVNATPSTPTPSNGGPYCEGATIQLFTPAVTGATYSWSGPGGFTSTQQNPTRAGATVADSGAYSVTVTVNGCTSAAGTTNVIVNPIPATPTATNGGPYCSGATIQLSTPFVSGATYSWTGPNGFTSSQQNPTRANATTADAGTYSVTITVNGCMSAAGTTSVVVNPTPATPTASNGGPYCSGATISLSTPFVSGATYSWTGPNGFTSSQQNPTRANATTADAGTYSVTVTVSGCTSAAGTTNVVVNPTPATPTASNGGPYCEGATIQLSTPLVAGATYSWTGPSGFASAQQNPTRANATTADAGTYSVTVTVNGCTSAAGTTNVVVNPTPATPTASNGGPYCEGSTIQLSTPFVSGATYSWTGPNGFTSSQQNPTRANATTADAGTYSVTITVNGCTSAAGTTNVVVNPTPATPTASNGGPYCSGATISLSTPFVSGATYSWTGPNGFTSSQQNPIRANATTADAGTYSVTVTVNGCTSAAGTTNVVVNPTPATPTASNGGPYCEGAAIQLSTPLVAGATYSWTGPNGFTSSQQNPTRANATTADAGTYSVTVTVNGCTSAAGTTNVVVNLTPATPTASNGGPYCEGATIQLSTPFVSGATYSWTGPNGFTSSQQNPTRANATTADAGTYSVTVTVNGCTSAAGTTNVVVNLTPATPTASNGGPYCEGSTIQLSSPTVSGATYSWTGPNGFTSAQQNPTRANATVADAGTYSVTVTVNGCTSAAGTTNVVVSAIPATPAASNGGPYCEGSTIQLSTPTVSGATYSWTGPNGFTSSQQNPTRANATTADAGTYSVTVTVNGCPSAAGTTSVVVNPTPATPSASNGGPYCEGATIQLSTPTVSGATYSWTGPNGFASSQQNPTRASATLADAGTYSVTVTVNGCTSAAGTTNVVVSAIPATPAASNGGPYCEGSTIQLSTPTVSGATYSWTGPNGFSSSQQNPTRASATLADAGAYSVTVTVNGCPSAPGTTSVVVNAIPVTPTITPGGPTTFCQGGSVTLTSSSATGNQWSVNGVPIGGATAQTYNATTSGNYTVVATDGNGCSSAPSAPVSVTVVATPATPPASNGGPYVAGDTIALSTPFVSGATYSWTGPNGFMSSLQNPTIPNATLAAAGTYSVVITVGGCPSASGTTNVVVTQSNHPPVFNPIGDKTVAEGSLLTFAISATDADGDTLTYSATSLPPGATFDVPSATFSWTPGYSAAGPYTATFGVSDGHGGTDSKTINITVTNTNRPPVLNPIGNRTVEAGSTLAFTVSATDPDGDSVTYSVTGLPSGATFNTSTGAFSWTPASPQIGFYNLTFGASDGIGGTASEAITITVTGPTPTAVVATATTPTSVSITWLPSTGAVSYEILRLDTIGGLFNVVGTSTSLAYADNSVSANTAYLYAVRGVNSGGVRSANSPVDLATTVIFSDDPIVAGTTSVRAVHFDQLRTSVNAVRTLAALAPAAFTDPSLAGIVIRKVHVDELRSALNAARSTLALTAVSYTDPAIIAATTTVKAVHINDLRNGVK